MPKLPKLSDLTDVSSIMNKMKSAFDSFAGPSTTNATEEALSRESDPVKAKFLEVELLINQLHDLTVIQNKTLSDLKAKFTEVNVIAKEALEKQQKSGSEPPLAQKTTDSTKTNIEPEKTEEKEAKAKTKDEPPLS